MASEIREFPADTAAPAVRDEWTTFLQNYTNTISNLVPNGLETRRSEFLAFAMMNDSETSPVLIELRKLIDDMRQNENSTLRHWAIILNITFLSLQQIANAQNRQKNSQLNDFNDIPQSHFRDDSHYLTLIELWEPRVRLLLRLAPSVRQDRSLDIDPRITAAREAALSQCCPIRMMSPQGRSFISSISEDNKAAAGDRLNKKTPSASANHYLDSAPSIAGVPFDELLYSLPNLKIGLYPNSVPLNHDLRKLIILSAILNDAARQSRTQLLEWAKKVLEALMDEAQKMNPAIADSDIDLIQLARHLLPTSLLIFLCVKNGLLTDGRIIQLLHEQITRRWLKSILDCDSTQGFQVLQRLPIQPAQTKFLLARAYIEAQQTQTCIGDPALRQSYEQWLHHLRQQDNQALPTLYLEIWCCLYDRMSGSTEGSVRAVIELDKRPNTYLNAGSSTFLRLMAGIQSLSDELVQESCEQTPVAGSTFTKQLVDCLSHQRSAEFPEQIDLVKILAYVTKSNRAPTRGAFTRAVLSTYHQTHSPSWFRLTAFVIWSSWVASFLDIPYIPHYIATHQKDLPDTQYALTALKEYRTGLCSAPQKNAALSQLTRIIGAALGDSEMITILANETGFTPRQIISPHGMLLSFVQNCVSLSHI